jgi:GT2 family glycosyltransferase
MLTVRGPTGVHTITADAPADGIENLPPLARPRRVNVSAATLKPLGSPLAVTDATGRHLLGSPIWPSTPSYRIPSAKPNIDLRHRETDIVIPVYGNIDATLACLNTVLNNLPAHTIVHVVDDASPDPACTAALDQLAQTGRILLHRHPDNRGFPAAANTGLRAAAGRDVILLNSDTLVPPGWLGRLRAAAYAAPEIGTATPLSNDGTIVSYAGTGDLDAIAQRANSGLTADLPVGIGFCLYMRRDCLDQVGPLRDDLFAQGYGEESDFCLRARHTGWRHVAALDLFVAHQGGGSFGAGRTDLRRRNHTILERHYPEYAAQIATHLATDPLFAARRRMDSLRWADGREPSAVVLITHGEGGGVTELVAARAAAIRNSGARPVLLLPAPGGCRIDGYDDLRFAMPDELPALAELLRHDRPTHVELHHWLGHAHGLLDLSALLGIPVESWVHDAASFCPRIALIGRGRRYCGEPPLTECEACVAELGSNLDDPIAVADLAARSSADFAGSRRVVVPTADTARRIRRHFPAVQPDIVPWEDDRALPPLDPAPPAATTRVCVIGAIGVEKGYDVLLDCAGDVRRRGLPLEFVVCGVTEDDELLMAAGPIFVTGRYAPAEAVELIREQRAQLAFIPSIWPETWCFALSRAWQAGLPAVAFDLGAPAERIRATGRGHLLPLGLPVARINDALLRLAPASAGLQPWRAT